ncbi:hypothetical protein BDR06DRAFT_969938 [Suillus hirtellus]|nr:hypothetical protein BDR06DRAFT_969938 [Suillus hirtellus]
MFSFKSDIMAVPPKVANDALNATLAVMQSLAQCCIKVKKGDPEGLKLSDEIARHVTFDTGKRLKTIQWECYIILPTATLICRRYIPATVPIPPALIVPPSTPSTPPSMPSQMDLDVIAKLVDKLKRWVHLYFPEAEREQWKVASAASDSKKRKAEDEGANTVAKKMRKLKSDVKKEPTGVIHVKRRASNSLPIQESSPVATDKDVLLVGDKDFLDAETRPAEWGSDSDVATPWQHSVRYHPRCCNKCAKLDIACIVLPDKKFGYTRLTCANCDNMKIACAIDGVGNAAKASSDACKTPKTSKSRAVSEKVVAHPSRSQRSIAGSKGAEKQPREVLPGQAQIQPEHRQSPAPTNLLEPEPTARDILQGIQDLSRRLDLLAANERVDTLEVRVGSVETNLLQQLDELEQQLNKSDAQWQSLESLK